MLSNIDQLLLSKEEQEELKKATLDFDAAAAVGDEAGKKAAHARAESIRARAGYSGGEDGSRYTLLKSAGASDRFNAYQNLVEKFARSEMSAIETGMNQQLDALDAQKKSLQQQGEKNQQAARSAAWNQERLAESGFLNRGFENTGLADVITATALNHAAANAYQALLDQREDLAENEAAKAKVRSGAMEQVADLQRELSSQLGKGFLDIQQDEADFNQQMALQKFKTAANADSAEKDYFYKLALQQLKRQWELEDLARGV